MASPYLHHFHRKYLNENHTNTQPLFTTWKRDLSESLDHENMPLKRPVDWATVERQQRGVIMALLQRCAMIPPRIVRGSGSAQVTLVYALAKTLEITEAAAFALVMTAFEMNQRKAPLKNYTVYKSSKRHYLEFIK